MDDLKTSENEPSASDTILLIDDQAMVLDVGEQLLQRMGYCVLTASCGTEAIDLYQSHKAQVKLIILDMRMPDMDGKQTFMCLKGINPDVKVLLTTGFHLSDQATEMLACGCKGFIQKPYKMSELSSKVQEVLDTN
jgi:DNA-binding NtrC family response regulator